MPTIRRPALSLPVALALVAAGACSPSTGQVERGLERELVRVVGPADGYDVHIEGLRADEGEADLVVAEGLGVRPPDLPAVDRIRLDLRDVRYDRKQDRLERVGDARADVTVTAPALADYLERQPSIDDADVELEAPDRAVLQLRPNLGGFTLPAGVRARVSGRIVPDGSRIRFEITDVRAGAFSLGEGGRDALSGLVNPLVDLSELPIPLRVTGVRVEGGAIRLEAVGGTAALGDAAPGSGTATARLR